jgi:phospholipid-transporting ATPase
MQRVSVYHMSYSILIMSSAAPIKRTALERQVNIQIVFLFVLLLALSIGSTIGSSIRLWFFSNSQWYLLESSSFGGRGQ